MGTSVVSNDGQNVIIIIAPSSPQNPPSPTFTKINVDSPSPATTSDYESSCDTDPEWSPSPNPANTIPSPRHQPINSTPGATKTIKKEVMEAVECKSEEEVAQQKKGSKEDKKGANEDKKGTNEDKKGTKEDMELTKQEKSSEEASGPSNEAV